MDNQTINRLPLASLAGSRYNGLIDLYFWDETFKPWESEKDLQDAYRAFQKSMWKVRLTRWIKNKLDCEDWSRLFVSHVLIRNALSDNKYPMALGLLTYNIEADSAEHQAICVAVVKHGKSYKLVELEPQPNQGIKELAKEELSTVCRVSF